MLMKSTVTEVGDEVTTKTESTYTYDEHYELIAEHTVITKIPDDKSKTEIDKVYDPETGDVKSETKTETDSEGNSTTTTTETTDPKTDNGATETEKTDTTTETDGEGEKFTRTETKTLRDGDGRIVKETITVYERASETATEETA